MQGHLYRYHRKVLPRVLWYDSIRTSFQSGPVDSHVSFETVQYTHSAAACIVFVEKEKKKSKLWHTFHGLKITSIKKVNTVTYHIHTSKLRYIRSSPFTTRGFLNGAHLFCLGQKVSFPWLHVRGSGNETTTSLVTCHTQVSSPGALKARLRWRLVCASCRLSKQVRCETWTLI